jgi:uncharacterized protein
VALELRPNCEYCDKDLPPHAPDAMICSYECTFCAECVEGIANVCPNCGGRIRSEAVSSEVRVATGAVDCEAAPVCHASPPVVQQV